ncbi:MAG TPA: hypothetical protein VLT86_07695 [Vicinamibacterales bacterium]|nr:hypothetical protein [Vicinamibacterales bacterium]
MRLLILAGVACMAAVGLLPTRVDAQAAAQSLGSVTISKKVMANGQPLAAGTYTVRLSADTVSAVVGQSADSEKWVEFVQGGQVKGKELATVVGSADVKTVSKEKPPAAGTSRVDLLKGADYLRVWINKGGTHYLIHLTLATS